MRKMEEPFYRSYAIDLKIIRCCTVTIKVKIPIGWPCHKDAKDLIRSAGTRSPSTGIDWHQPLTDVAIRRWRTMDLAMSRSAYHIRCTKDGPTMMYKIPLTPLIIDSMPEAVFAKYLIRDVQKIYT